MKLLGLWQSSMVLQRNCVNVLYGVNANDVTVEFCEKIIHSVKTQSGFRVSIDSLPEGGPYEMLIKSEEEQVLLNDIYIGDVWLLGGQSNMELPIRRTLDVTENDIKNLRMPHIKAFLHKQRYLSCEQPDIAPDGEWISADTGRILDFSGIGYYFAKQIAQQYNVPVGIIQTAQGGTKIECWFSSKHLKSFCKDDDENVQGIDEKQLEQSFLENQVQILNWQNALLNSDKGVSEQWYSNKPQTQSALMPQSFEAFIKKDFNGVLWLFKTFELENTPMQDAKLLLGAIVDADKTYINGKLIGETTYRYPPRKYNIPSKILKKGINTITVRVEISQGHGGFVTGKSYAVITEAQTIDLSGEWQFAIGAQCEPQPPQIFPQGYPSRLYNGMIYPLRHTKICGVAFYQGESNTASASGYCEKLLAAVECWRSLFQNPKLPFLFVQLANYADPFVSGGFAQIRLQQLKAAKLLQNAGMAVSIDVGEDNDLHPQDKITVAKRLFELSRKYAYGEAANPDAPYPRLASQSGSEIIITLENAQALYVKNNSTSVTVCYKNQEQHKCSAKVKDNFMIIANAKENAQGVEYLNQDAPQCNIVYNEKEQPCSPFVCTIKQMKQRKG